jgi:hypothetical protein
MSKSLFEIVPREPAYQFDGKKYESLAEAKLARLMDATGVGPGALEPVVKHAEEVIAILQWQPPGDQPRKAAKRKGKTGPHPDWSKVQWDVESNAAIEDRLKVTLATVLKHRNKWQAAQAAKGGPA